MCGMQRTHNTDEQRFFRAIGRALEEARKARGLNQSELGAKIGTKFNAISRLERGMSSPSMLTLWRLSGALRVPVTELVDRAHALAEDVALLDERRARLADTIRKLPARELGTLAAIVASLTPRGR